MFTPIIDSPVLDSATLPLISKIWADDEKEMRFKITKKIKLNRVFIVENFH
jgi:hypothetical protein